MRHSHVLAVSLLFCALILSSGCISLEIKQTMNRDGTSSLEIVYDLSKIKEMYEAMASEQEDSGMDFTSGFEENFTNMCEQLQQDVESGEGRLTNVKCRTTDDYKVIISGDVPQVPGDGFKVVQSFPYTTYIYDTKEIYKTMSGMGESQGQELSDESLRQAKAMYGMMNIEMKYIIVMPGTIVRADIGEIEGNRVVMDMLDFAEKKSVYVESQELDTSIYPIIGVIIAVIAAALLLLRRRG